MIVVPVKEGENIEKALKKFKRKFEKTGIVKELRSRQQFDKPSVTKRLKKERAVRAVRQGIQGQQQERELKQRRRDDRDHRRADDRGCERDLARMVGSALGIEP